MLRTVGLGLLVFGAVFIAVLGFVFVADLPGVICWVLLRLLLLPELGSLNLPIVLVPRLLLALELPVELRLLGRHLLGDFVLQPLEEFRPGVVVVTAAAPEFEKLELRDMRD